MKMENELYEYVETLSTDDLIDIVDKLEDYELVSAALIELDNRDQRKMIELSKNIVIDQKGDKHLQAMALELMYDADPELAIKSIYNKIPEMNEALLGSLMEELVVDCFQEISNKFTSKMLRMIRDRYNQFDIEKQEHIKDNYLEFIKIYKSRM